jgi:hypothetical protein
MIVADAGPNYLLLIETENVLKSLYGRVLVPDAVAAELLDAAQHLLDFDVALARLRETSFYLSATLVDRIRRRPSTEIRER